GNLRIRQAKQFFDRLGAVLPYVAPHDDAQPSAARHDRRQARLEFDPATIRQERYRNVHALGVAGQIANGVRSLGLEIVNVVNVRLHDYLWRNPKNSAGDENLRLAKTAFILAKSLILAV